MGFKNEQMLVIDFNHDEKVATQIEAIKNIFLEQPGVTSVLLQEVYLVVTFQMQVPKFNPLTVELNRRPLHYLKLMLIL